MLDRLKQAFGIGRPGDDFEFCDEYQRTAVLSCLSLDSSFSWNKFAEYPRISWRIPRHHFTATDIWKKWLYSTM